MSVILRSAQPEEAVTLTALVLRSKAHWGYGPEMMATFIDALTLRPAQLAEGPAWVADIDGRPAGFASIGVEGSEARLEMLFVDPWAIGRGVGRLLWNHALAEARSRGAARLVVDADPSAASFYERMGARRTGLVPSGSIRGRMLPALTIEL
jgi:GNAT superfamily N-acetyltransferase